MHDAVIIEVNGKKREVDRKVAPLIQELNKLGLRTRHSCQGGHSKNGGGRAYVSIQLDEESNFHYHIEEKILTIRWNLPEQKEKFMPVEPFIVTNFGVYKFSEILPRLEREHKARFGNLQKIERGN